MKKYPLILAIDTSCDETSAAITYGDRVSSNVVSSQINLHKIWGGVVPDIARRAHQEKINYVIAKALMLASRSRRREITWQEIDAVAVTYGPGLAIALEVGIAKAKELCKKYSKHMIAVNHLEGHLLSPLAKNIYGNKGITLNKKDFPLMGVIISGKHTELVIMYGLGQYEIIGETLDDAIGEAYDKTGRMLELGYPAGPIVTEFAKKGNLLKYPLPIPMHNKKDSLDFSFSGLKTAVYYLIKNKLKGLSKQDIYDISASFEYSAITHLQEKLTIALDKYRPNCVLVGGGVGASSAVRAGIRKTCQNFGLKAYFPYSKKLYMDNAAMIGVAAYYKYLRRDYVKDIEKLDRIPRLSIETI